MLWKVSCDFLRIFFFFEHSGSMRYWLCCLYGLIIFFAVLIILRYMKFGVLFIHRQIGVKLVNNDRLLLEYQISDMLYELLYFINISSYLFNSLVLNHYLYLLCMNTIPCWVHSDSLPPCIQFSLCQPSCCEREERCYYLG